MKHIYTIKKSDINKRVINVKCEYCNKIQYYIDIHNFMGYIMPCDIGKRIYHIKDNIFQVENQEQLNKRLKRELTI